MTTIQSILSRISLLEIQLEDAKKDVLNLAKPRCSNCFHWRQDKCAKWDAVPPEHVRLTGCEAWDFDDIPF